MIHKPRGPQLALTMKINGHEFQAKGPSESVMQMASEWMERLSQPSLLVGPERDAKMRQAGSE